MGKNKRNQGIQQGATNHAPSQHGDKTLRRVAEISQTSNPAEERIGPQYDPAGIRSHDHGPDTELHHRDAHSKVKRKN